MTTATATLGFAWAGPVSSITRRTRGPIIAATESRTARLDRLLGDVAGGDRAAFEQLYNLVAGAVFGTARSIVRDPSIAEEVAHDVLTEVWARAQMWRRELGSAATWIMTMTRRRAIDRVRSEQAHRDRTERVGAASGHTPHDVVAEAVIDAVDRSRVERALHGLSERQRESITLAFYEGKTQREIAELLGVPLGTIKTRIRDGLLRLEADMGGAT